MGEGQQGKTGRESGESSDGRSSGERDQLCHTLLWGWSGDGDCALTAVSQMWRGLVPGQEHASELLGRSLAAALKGF